ncbi:unnamed protein product [Gongylonema pulchrum]|uniref:Tetratricopeptide repeat protein 28 n=1 Tax=Gongylonema pulchrum TaxID=637853 RepID=A0A183E225_9BILA|nr:unnamed protein product [Gongylonema pulchrum]
MVGELAAFGYDSQYDEAESVFLDGISQATFNTSLMLALQNDAGHENAHLKIYFLTRSAIKHLKTEQLAQEKRGEKSSLLFRPAITDCFVAVKVSPTADKRSSYMKCLNYSDEHLYTELKRAYADVECSKAIQERRKTLKCLLGLLYEDGKRHHSTESDFMTDTSHMSDGSQRIARKHQEDELWKMDCPTLRNELAKMDEEVDYANSKLIRASKKRAHEMARQQKKCDIITAVLQAVSEKRGIFTVRHSLKILFFYAVCLEQIAISKVRSRPHNLITKVWIRESCKCWCFKEKIHLEPLMETQVHCEISFLYPSIHTKFITPQNQAIFWITARAGSCGTGVSVTGRYARMHIWNFRSLFNLLAVTDQKMEMGPLYVLLLDTYSKRLLVHHWLVYLTTIPFFMHFLQLCNAENAY